MYLDPGFGGMLVQAIVAIVAVGGGIAFSFRRKIRAAFSAMFLRAASGKNKDAADTVTAAQQNAERTEDDVVDTLSEGKED